MLHLYIIYMLLVVIIPRSFSENFLLHKTSYQISCLIILHHFPLFQKWHFLFEQNIFIAMQKVKSVVSICKTFLPCVSCMSDIQCAAPNIKYPVCCIMQIYVCYGLDNNGFVHLFPNKGHIHAFWTYLCFLCNVR